MTFFERTMLKEKLILFALSIGWFISMKFERMDYENEIWFRLNLTWLGFLILFYLFIIGSMVRQTEENERQEKEKEFQENWEKVWKGEPKIFKLLEENKTPDDFQTLISIISEFLDYCWFHPFKASSIVTRGSGQTKRDQERFKRKLDTAISEIHNLQLQHRFDGRAWVKLPDKMEWHLENKKFGAEWKKGYESQGKWIHAYEYSLDILYTIAEFCGIQKENGLGFYVEKLKNPGYENEGRIKDVPEENNFVNLGDPNIEILEKCDAIGSAFDKDYEIRDVSTFDFTKHKELEFDLARTLRCCICNILNTRLTEDIVVTLQGHGGSPSSYENDKIKRKFLDAMIIEIWAICGGLAIERKTYSDVRFQFSIESMQLERDRPKSAFRTKKSSDET